MVDISICLACVAMILSPFIVDSIHRARTARVIARTADSSSKCNNASSGPAKRCPEESHGKDGKQRTFPTFPRHGYGDLYESIHEICCTWNLNVPTAPKNAVRPSVR
jgi:hypothetical protein